MSVVADLPAKQRGPSFSDRRARLSEISSRHRSWTILIGMLLVGTALPLDRPVPAVHARPVAQRLDRRLHQRRRVFVLLAIGLNIGGRRGRPPGPRGYAAFEKPSTHAIWFWNRVNGGKAAMSGSRPARDQGHAGEDRDRAVGSARVAQPVTRGRDPVAFAVTPDRRSCPFTQRLAEQAGGTEHEHDDEDARRRAPRPSGRGRDGRDRPR